jgi:PAS domain S-box-containing protein
MDTRAGAVTLRERVLLELARRDKSDVCDTFQAITEAAAVVLDVSRVSIWALVDGGGPAGASSDLDTRIVCKDLYLHDERRHVSFMPIHGRDFPAYLRALHERRAICADDAQSDPRTSEFTSFYLKPLGITSMLDIPIWHDGGVYGVLCFEHVGSVRQWHPEEQSFAVNLADIASSCLEAAEHAAVSRRWETVVESLAEAVAVCDASGKVLHCNRVLRRNFLERNGVSSWEELLAEVDLVDAADRRIPGSDWPFQRVLRGERIQGEIYGLVFKRSGERRYVRLTCSPVVEEGQVKYVVFVIADATEEMFVERLKSELLSDVAHELKTPLAIAKGYAQQLERVETSATNRTRMLEAIVRACDRMDHLSETLLDLASMTLGRLRLTRERIDLAELTLSVVRRAERAAPDRRFKLETRPNVPVIVDSTRIAEAMRHIVDNAIAYSPAGSTIDVDLKTDGARVTVAVRDYGIGIPNDLRKNVFGLFFKGHAGTAQDKGGLGVGLYLAREILRRHGGDVWFESVEGEGSTFYLGLPLARTK